MERNHRICTKLCTLTPGIMMRRKIILDEIALAQTELNQGILELANFERRNIGSQVPVDWSPSKRSK